MRYNEIRRATKPVRVGDMTIGGNAPIVIQSMTNTDTHDRAGTLRQILALEAAGCDVVRITVPDETAAETICFLKEQGVRIPIVADIHYDYRIALRCAECGVDKIRINPGNIGDDERVRAVCRICIQKKIPIRIGVNSGSVEKHILAKYGAPTAQALCESAKYHVQLLERFDFSDIIVSIKASDVQTMIRANRLFACSCDYPIHLGVTEAGGGEAGKLKSAIGIGTLLSDGIGDTVRVSLTDNPVNEISAAKEILTALSVEGQCGMDIVSCPTCGRTDIDLIPLCERFRKAVVENGLSDFPIRVALMGCPVNGPGEAKEADIGICGGHGEALLIAHDEILDRIPESKIIERLILEIKKIKDGK